MRDILNMSSEETFKELSENGKLESIQHMGNCVPRTHENETPDV